MKTIIFDIDGTLTNMWAIEKSVLLRMTNERYKIEIEALKSSGLSDTYLIFTKATNRKLEKSKYWLLYNRAFSKNLRENELPPPERYPIVNWIKTNTDLYRFVYATGGQEKETSYVLKKLGILKYFDIKNSITKNTCRFSKKTGIPFRKIKTVFADCLVVADGENDYKGAKKSKIEFLKVTKKTCSIL
jgi:phosphoglycolate phosphatase-like HAD superfamily hydrolase